MNRAALTAAAVILALASGCSSLQTTKDSPPTPVAGETLVIPDFNTAREQLGYAVAYQRAQVMSAEPVRKKAQLDKINQALQRVVVNFPNDTEYAPLALLQIADNYGTMGDLKRAGEAYGDIANRYGSNEVVQARAMFSMARVRDKQGRYDEGKAIYKQLMDAHENSTTPALKHIGSLSKQAYFRARIMPEEGGTKRR